MTHYFLDSSTLSKRYVAEVGTNWVRAITAPGAGNSIIIARITPIEVVSGAMRRQREGTNLNHKRQLGLVSVGSR